MVAAVGGVVSRVLGVVVLLLAVVLRLPRLVTRWDEVAVAYAAYAAPAGEAVARGDLGGVLGAWVGLHPPLHAGLVGILDVVWGAPLGWLALSVSASLGAVWLVLRTAGPLAACVLATAPLQLMDAAEVNNYPLAVMGMAALCAVARAPWPWVVAAAGLATWGHVLGGVAAGALVLHRLLWPVDRHERVRLAAGAALVVAPVVVGAVRLAGQGSTFAQPAVAWGEWAALVGQSWGGAGIGIGVLTAILVLYQRRFGPVAWVWLATAVGYLAAVWGGVAASHQRPYLGLLGPPAVVLLGQALGAVRSKRWRRGLAAAVVVLCGVRAGLWGSEEAGRLASIRADLAVPRGIDAAWTKSAPGDAVWLIAPALQADDDKTDHSSVLWRLRPWWSMPRVAPPGLTIDDTDWLYGHPRRVQGRSVHTATEVSARHFDHAAGAVLEAGSTVYVVLYDHAPAAGLVERTERVLRAYRTERQVVSRSSGLGDDIVWTVHHAGGS